MTIWFFTKDDSIWSMRRTLKYLTIRFKAWVDEVSWNIFASFQNQTKELFASLPYIVFYIARVSSPPSLWPMITRSRHRIYKTLSNRYRLSPLKIQRESKPDYKKKNILWHLMPTADRSGGSSKEKCSKSDLGNNSAAPQAPATPLLQPVITSL